MKLFSILLCILFWTAACNNNTVRNSPADSVSSEPAVQTLCFQRLAGTGNQDTSSIRLVIDGNEVTGDFQDIPYEKDSRKGTITAFKLGDVIKGVWLYMQEGMQDTLSVEFRLSGNTLLQKNYSVNPETGRQYLSDESRFVIEYKQAGCDSIPAGSAR